MDGATLPSIESVKRQGRALKNTYFFLGTALMVTSISLAAFISHGHFIFDETQIQPNNVKAELDFNGIDKNAPIPLLMNAEKTVNEPVKVLGAEVTKTENAGIEYSPPSTLLRDTYIRSFTFVQTQETDSVSTISASWNSRKSSLPQLYVIKQSQGTTPSEDDLEIYSVEGSRLEVSSHTFEVDSKEGNLYLSIYERNKNGNYVLMNESLLAQSSN